jgi:hypothetical protein
MPRPRRHCISHAEDDRDEIVEIENPEGHDDIPAVIESREEMAPIQQEARMETLDLRIKLSGESSTIHSTGRNS